MSLNPSFLAAFTNGDAAFLPEPAWCMEGKEVSRESLIVKPGVLLDGALSRFSLSCALQYQKAYMHYCIRAVDNGETHA